MIATQHLLQTCNKPLTKQGQIKIQRKYISDSDDITHEGATTALNMFASNSSTTKRMEGTKWEEKNLCTSLKDTSCLLRLKQCTPIFTYLNCAWMTLQIYAAAFGWHTYARWVSLCRNVNSALHWSNLFSCPKAPNRMQPQRYSTYQMLLWALVEGLNKNLLPYCSGVLIINWLSTAFKPLFRWNK